MTNLLKRGSQFLNEKRHGSMSESIVYRRGDSLSVPISATLGKSEFEEVGIDGGIVNVESTDFIIQAADLDFGGGPTEPAEGDLIEFEQQGTTYTQIVTRMGSEKPWRFTDGFKLGMRIHTRLKRRAAV